MNDKVLYLVRHAQSGYPGNILSDFDRPLDAQGFRDASEMGRRLKTREYQPEILLCSKAKRAIQTLENMALCVDHVIFDERIYESSKSNLLEIVRSLKGHHGSAMLIGHNPSMSWLAGELSGVPVNNMPTCSIVTIRLETSHWSKTGICPAELLDFDYPDKAVE